MSWDLFIGCWLITSGVTGFMYRAIRAARLPVDYYKGKSAGFIFASFAARVVIGLIDGVLIAYGITLVARSWPS